MNSGERNLFDNEATPIAIRQFGTFLAVQNEQRLHDMFINDEISIVVVKSNDYQAELLPPYLIIDEKNPETRKAYVLLVLRKNWIDDPEESQEISQLPDELKAKVKELETDGFSLERLADSSQMMALIRRKGYYVEA